MKRQTARRSSLFLFEIIIALFFFCVASMLCLQLFAKAHVLSQEAKELDMAVNQTASIAELFQNEEHPLSYLQSQYPHSRISDSGETLILFYDTDWISCSEESFYYQIQVDVTAKDALIYGSITAKNRDGEALYSLETNKLVKGGPGL